MTAIALDRDFALPAPSQHPAQGLRLPAAAGSARAFLVVHFAPPVAGGDARASDTPSSLLDASDEAAQAFVAELRELGGMAVIA